METIRYYGRSMTMDEAREMYKNHPNQEVLEPPDGDWTQSDEYIGGLVASVLGGL